MFPDDQLNALPPEGVSVGMKAFIIFGIFAVVLAIVFSKFFVSKGRRTQTSGKPSSAFSIATSLTIDQDRAIAYQAEKEALEDMLEFIEEAREENLISTSGFVKAKKLIQGDILLLQQSLEELASKPGIILLEEKVEEEDFSDLEADLQSRLEQDPFVPRRTKTVKEIFETSKSTPVQQSAPAPQPPARSSIPAPQPPARSSIPAPQPPAQSSIPAPQPPARSSIPAPQPPARSSIPAPQPPTQSSTPTPQPPARSSIPAPQPPTKASIPTPQPPAMPSATQPSIQKAHADDSKFAKTTSIAALRMDMLKELARLKKYINEEEEQ